MSSSEKDVRLSAGDAELTVSPANGCRISSLRIGGTELLRQGERYGCFPMVPWCGRMENGQFRNGGVLQQMPLTAPPHAIHGTGRDTVWQTDRETGTEASFHYDLAEPWPYPGRVTQTFELSEDSVTLAFGIETYGDSFPAQAGWHPGSGAASAARTSGSPSTRPGRRSGARTICRPAAASRRWTARGTTPSGCPTESM